MTIQYVPYFLLFYGLICLTLMIIGIVEMDAATGNSSEIFGKLSENAKEFFKNSNSANDTDAARIKNLADQRYENTQFCVIFGGVVSALILMQACFVFVLRSKRDLIVEKNIELAPEDVKEREIIKSKHECCVFPHVLTYQDPTLELLGIIKKDKKKKK